MSKVSRVELTPVAFADPPLLNVVGVHEPFALSVRVPWVGPLTRMAVRASPSTSLSLASTPGAATVSAVSSLVLEASSPATGASLTGVTVMRTVATSLFSTPSLAL